MFYLNLIFLYLFVYVNTFIKVIEIKKEKYVNFLIFSTYVHIT